MNKSAQFVLIGSLSIALGACLSDNSTPIKEYEPVPYAVGNVVNLEQNWSEQIQQAFYYTSQGSRIMPYQWFLYLKQASNTNLFRSDANIISFQYIPAKPSDNWNPDGLPVGFVKDVDSKGQDWVGLTCAACHTTQIEYQGQIMRIDGGPTMADFTKFNVQLVEAMSATYRNSRHVNKKKFVLLVKF